MSKLRHGCLLNIKYEDGSKEFIEFFAEAKRMVEDIGLAREHHSYRQTDENCPYKYGFVQEFDSIEDLQKFIAHPRHDEYVEDYWLAGIVDFVDFDLFEFE
jgi:heme-degrading monooxygenase HmoA